MSTDKEKVQFGVTKRQWIIIKDLAEKEGLPVAAYVRQQFFRTVNNQHCNILSDKDNILYDGDKICRVEKTELDLKIPKRSGKRGGKS